MGSGGLAMPAKIRDLLLIRKSTVSRRAAASGRSPDPIRVSLVDL
jgi:hypothetical protein